MNNDNRNIILARCAAATVVYNPKLYMTGVVVESEGREHFFTSIEKTMEYFFNYTTADEYQYYDSYNDYQIAIWKDVSHNLLQMIRVVF